jgi:hypothetical protein
MTAALRKKSTPRIETQSFSEPRNSESDTIAVFSGQSVRRIIQSPRIRWFESAKDELQELCRLERGWDGYEGQPVLFANAVFALQILENTCTENTTKPQFVPGVRGDIQVEWHTPAVDLEVYVRAPYDVDVWFRDCETGPVGQEEHLERDFGPLLHTIQKLS